MLSLQRFKEYVYKKMNSMYKKTIENHPKSAEKLLILP